MTFRVAIAGCTGYAGGEILRILANHPEIEIGALTANSSAGTKLWQHHPHLGKTLGEREVLATNQANLANHDVVFLALPHGTSAAIAAQLEDSLVIDAGADFRLESALDWEEYYGTPHAGTWPYGLPELPGQRQILAQTKQIAVPGCYPTTVTLGLLPALAQGLVTGEDVVVMANSGCSGAGKSAKTNLLGAELMGSCTAYSVGGSHRHIPEILQNFKKAGATAATPSLSFTPVLAPMPRGILAAISAPLAKIGLNTEELWQNYREYYAEEPSICVLPPGIWPKSQAVIGSNQVQIQVAVDEKVGRILVVSTLDNLYKGTAGGAVQSMNIALGLPEFTGLNLLGVAP